ncbi:MAG: M15 family metallopeptidase [Alphaproteobacteria bacterium]
MRSGWGAVLALFWTLVFASAAHAGPPPEPSRALRALIGQYGEPGDILTLYERNGTLHAQGAGISATGLIASSNGRFQTPGGVEIRTVRGGVSLAGVRRVRRDFGAETEAAIRRTVKADPAALRAMAARATPPVEAAPARPFDLVDLASVDPTLRFDIRYSTSNNFMGLPLYDRPGAYLQRPAAEALGRVQRALRSQGYGLLVHDAYRPWSVTWMFWEATPEASRMFVADPAKGSRHNRGGAVDLTLYDLQTGRVVEMPSRYDEMSPRAYADFPGGTSRQRWLRDLLRQAMTVEGFEVLAEEWWHFDYRDWRQYGIGTATFAELSAGRPQN